MDAKLDIEDGIYHLDWGNNPLEDRPILITNGQTGKRWSIFDILLDIVRIIPESPSVIYCSPKLKRELLKAYCFWIMDWPTLEFLKSLGSNLVLDGIDIPLEINVSISGIVIPDYCFVVNI